MKELMICLGILAGCVVIVLGGSAIAQHHQAILDGLMRVPATVWNFLLFLFLIPTTVFCGQMAIAATTKGAKQGWILMGNMAVMLLFVLFVNDHFAGRL